MLGDRRKGHRSLIDGLKPETVTVHEYRKWKHFYYLVYIDK